MPTIRLSKTKCKTFLRRKKRGSDIRAEDVKEIIEEHLIKGKIVKRLALIEMDHEK